MSLRLLVNSDEFWCELEKDLRSAKHKIYLQTFSFEGDRVGHSLSTILNSKSNLEIKLLIDDFSNWVINDKFIYWPTSLFDSGLQQEIASTQKLIKQLRDNGIQIQYTNPSGILFSKVALRNHKKMILIDDNISYIGGFNFSEHNFEWHDIMFRIEDRNVSQFLSKDFDSTFHAKSHISSLVDSCKEIHTLDGFSNQRIFDRVLGLIESATYTIYIETPYLSFPFIDSLKKAQSKGVRIVIITPSKNNWKLVQDYIIQETILAGFELHFYQEGMSHLKAILIDEKLLITGSSNFDYLSYRLHEEVLLFLTDSELIEDFKRRVLKKDLANSVTYKKKSNLRATRLLNWHLRNLAKAIAFFGLLVRKGKKL